MVNMATVRNKVSVVVPVFNTEAYLRACIDSLLSQTYTQLEIILVDDGSTDNASEICDEFANKDQRVRVIHQSNGGVSDARNTGIHAATGEYIAFLDSDDYVDKILFEDVVSLATKNNADVVIWGFFADYLDSKGRLRQSVKHLSISATYFKDQNHNIAITPSLMNLLGYTWNKLYRLAHVRKHNLEFRNDLSLFEDIVFNSITLSRARIICFSDKMYTHYMQRNRSTLGKAFYENRYELSLERIKAQERFLKAWKVDRLYIDVFVVKGYSGVIRSGLMNICTSSIINRSEKIRQYQMLGERRDFRDLLYKSRPENRIDSVLKTLVTKKRYIMMHAFLSFVIFLKRVYHKLKYGS